MWWAVGLGAVVGSPCRFLLDSAVSRRIGRGQPWGTLLINLSGSLVLGVLAGLLVRGDLSPLTYALLGTGLCGSYTTFSTFVWETLALVEDHRMRTAVLNVVLTITLGIAVAYVAYVLSGPRP